MFVSLGLGGLPHHHAEAEILDLVQVTVIPIKRGVSENTGTGTLSPE